jgi:hypothetical protein
MIPLQVEAPTYELIKDVSGYVLFVICAIWLVRYLMSKQELLQKANETLLSQIQQDHKESRDKILEMHEHTLEKHDECTQKYAELQGKANEALNNAAHAIDRLTDKISTIK